MSDGNVTGTPTIVVGVDGSVASEDALRWAAAQAELIGGELRVTCAWHVPAGYGYTPNYVVVDFEAEVRAGVDATILKVLGLAPGIPVVVDVTQGHPAEVLLAASRHADLLVMGSRGRGAFTGMLLGSVSQHCVQHASCPVLITRHAPE